jgi:BirA family biotin operon repressor/biotin-[acetyl-CoA-carboxylase] ligase
VVEKIIDECCKSDTPRVKIKWPNDILLNRKKLCGILMERYEKSYIIGIGLNVNQIDFPGLPNATSLKKEYQKDFDLNNLIVNIISGFDKNLNLLEPENIDKLFEEWKSRSCLIGTKIRFNKFMCEVVGFTINGGIIINSQGIEKTYFSGIIELL